MNANQRAQINEARLKSIRDSHCIDATGRHSEGYIVNSEREFDALERKMGSQEIRDRESVRVHSIPISEKD